MTRNSSDRRPLRFATCHWSTELPYTPWRDRGVVVDGDVPLATRRAPPRPARLDRVRPRRRRSGRLDRPEGGGAGPAPRHQAFVAVDDVEPESMRGGAGRCRSPRGRTIPTDGVHARYRAAPARGREPTRPGGSRRDGRARRSAGVRGGCVCFPNRWDLPSKLGCTMAEVHAPVARLERDSWSPRSIASSIGSRPSVRSGDSVGAIIDIEDGYTPSGRNGRPRPTAPAASEMFVRVERETLRRFPRTSVVLFTIRTYVAPTLRRWPRIARLGGVGRGDVRRCPRLQGRRSRASTTWSTRWRVDDASSAVSFEAPTWS